MASGDGPGEHELLQRLRRGSRDAFDALFRAHYPRLVAVAHAVLGDRDLAEEVAQEVMLELWRRHATLALDTSLAAYLTRAARNRALNQLRHQRVVRAAEPHLAAGTVPAPAADHTLREAELDAAVRAAVAALPGRCREVFELSRVQGLTYAEIARVLDISVKTVEAQMGKALRVLRERLAPWLPQGGGP